MIESNVKTVEFKFKSTIVSVEHQHCSQDLAKKIVHKICPQIHLQNTSKFSQIKSGSTICIEMCVKKMRQEMHLHLLTHPNFCETKMAQQFVLKFV